MKRSTKIALTGILVAIGLLVFFYSSIKPWLTIRQFQPNPTSSKIVQTSSNEDPYNITNTKFDENPTVFVEAVNMQIGSHNLARFTYSNAADTAYSAGQPIILQAGKPATIRVKNSSGMKTNIHWHGLTIPNDMDGAFDELANGSTKVYSFTPTETGTYWYHSHYRPVETQVGNGMFGPLIVKSEADSRYDLDEILMLSDLTSSGGMMGSSNDASDMINGQTGENSHSLQLSGGQIAQLRFINASADNTKNVNFPFSVRVTHQDGYALAKPYTTKNLTLYPGQRMDVEVVLADTENQSYTIQDGNASIRLNYQANTKAAKKSPFVPAKGENPAPALLGKVPDFTIALAGGMSGWTMNGKTFPDTAAMPVKIGQTVKVRFTNGSGMMSIDHPIHIHGAHFQILAINGVSTNDNTWYDTYPIKTGTTTDIAIAFSETGTWVIHCHILNHEDNGMMAAFKVS